VKGPNAVHGSIVFLVDQLMCRRAFTTTAVSLKTPKGCEVNVRARNAHETLCDLRHKVNVTTDGVDRVHKIDSDIL
jgi:hypothetical protein